MDTEKIKIFVDAHSFDAGFQGTQTFIEGLYNALMKDHPDLDIYFGACNTDRIQKAFPSLDSSRILSYKKRSAALLRFLIDIPDLIQKHSFDFAHFQYVSPAANEHCKYIVTIHDVLFNDFSKEFSWSYRQNRNFLFSRSIQKAEIKTTVSEYSRCRICEHYKIPEEQLAVIPNAVSNVYNDDIPIKKAREQLKEKYGIENFILYVSRIEPRKNHLLLLNKFFEMELYKQGISLLFIGKRSIKVRGLAQRIWSLTAEQKKFFYWLEEVDNEDLVLFYRSCRVFVYPSKAEGFGIPPLEAAMCKIPVLCSNATAMAEFNFFEPNTFNPANAIEFESKLKHMIDSPESSEHLNGIAKKLTEKYSWEKSASLFYQLIRSKTTS